MSNDNVIDDRITASLRSLRPDRWNRWIEAGRRGQEQAKVLRLLIKASKELPYFTRLSHFVQACVEKSGISTMQASQALGIDLGENCQAMDEASFSTFEATELLQLDREYVRSASLLACFPSDKAPQHEPSTPDFVRLARATDLIENPAESKVDVSHSKSNFLSARNESNLRTLRTLTDLLASKMNHANPEEIRRIKQCTQSLDAWLTTWKPTAM